MGCTPKTGQVNTVEIILPITSLRGRYEAQNIQRHSQTGAVIEAIRGEKTLNEIALSYGVHAHWLGHWKKLVDSPAIRY